MSYNEDDIFLLKLVNKGNEQAFKLLFDTYFTPLCRFVRLYVKEGTQAEEIVLEVFENVWELRKTIQIQVTVKAYLCGKRVEHFVFSAGNAGIGCDPKARWQRCRLL